MLPILIKLVDAGQLGGWSRAAVGVILGTASGWFGGALVPFLTSEFQTALGVVVSTIVIGAWSLFAKKLVK